MYDASGLSTRYELLRRRPPVLFFRPPLLFFRLADFLLGTLAPFFRASLRPIATACLRLFTFPPRPPLLRLSVPFFLRRIALSTLRLAAAPYFLPPLRDDFFLVDDFRVDFFAAMLPPG
ncbi:MAG TPA: hypothetical protein VFJ50_05065 [Gemmatimonadales bacterium]|nr:hypothetical protein [Gemmatimonadales bacterium]